MNADEILSLDPIRDYDLVIKELEALDIKVKPLKCNKCRHDHYMILLEELGLLEEAPLTPIQSYIWKGVKINKKSSPDLINEFCRANPRLCKRKQK